MSEYPDLVSYKDLTPEKKYEFLDNVFYYEINMLSNCYWCMAKAKSLNDVILGNIALESFVIHARIIKDFFNDKRSKNHEDDALYSDFLNDDTNIKAFLTQIKKTTDDITNKSNKQVAHLTYTRFNYVDSRKYWHVKRIYIDIISLLLTFIDSLEEYYKTKNLMNYRSHIDAELYHYRNS